MTDCMYNYFKPGGEHTTERIDALVKASRAKRPITVEKQCLTCGATHTITLQDPESQSSTIIRACGECPE